MLEAARDLGASRCGDVPAGDLAAVPAAIVVSLLLTCLPMLGDYFTNDLLSASPNTVDGRQPDQRPRADPRADRAGRRVRDAGAARVGACRCCYYVRVTPGPATRRAVVSGPGRLVARPVAPAAGAARRHRRSTSCGRCCRCWSPCCSRSTPAGPAPPGRASRCGGTTATRCARSGTTPACTPRCMHTLRLGRGRDRWSPCPLGVALALGLDRWRGRLPGGRQPRCAAVVRAARRSCSPSRCCSWSPCWPRRSSSAPPAQVIGLVTFQLSYPVVIVRARLLTIGQHYEEAAVDLGASPLGAVRRVLLPMLMPAIFASAVLVFADVIDDFVHRALPVRRLLDRAGVGEGLQHRAGGPDARAQRAGHPAAASPSLLAVVLGFLAYRWFTRGREGRPRPRRLRRRDVDLERPFSPKRLVTLMVASDSSSRTARPGRRSRCALGAVRLQPDAARARRTSTTPCSRGSGSSSSAAGCASAGPTTSPDGGAARASRWASTACC